MTRATRSVRAGIGAFTIAALLAGCTAAPQRAGSIPASTTTAGLTDADGYIPDGDALPLDSGKPAVTGLDPTLLSALRSADRAAEDERGIALTISDGWRSERYQSVLFERAVQKYGSEEEAERWVKRGADSAHVSGHAVDIATADAMDFLNRFGARWGICQVYANELWHFELRTLPGGTCPPMNADGRG